VATVGDTYSFFFISRNPNGRGSAYLGLAMMGKGKAAAVKEMAKTMRAKRWVGLGPDDEAHGRKGTKEEEGSQQAMKKKGRNSKPSASSLFPSSVSLRAFPIPFFPSIPLVNPSTL
jgi:hypothetical protein